MSFQKLHRHQADQSEAGGDDRLAELRARQPDALERDGAEHGEGRFVVGHGVGHMRAEVDRYGHGLGMLAVGDYPVAGSEARNTRAGLQHRPDIAVAERQRLVELVEHGFERRRQPVDPDLVERLAHLVGLLARLADEAGLTEIDQHPLRAGGNQRVGSADQHLPAR